MKKSAVLLVNLGTPSEPSEKAVKRYLKEFLWDKKVVGIPRLIWWFILHFVVLRTRPKESAKAYQKIWTDEGSPLMVNSKKVSEKLQAYIDQRKPGRYEVVLGMRYGEPSIKAALMKIKNLAVDDVILLPLYPQFATSSSCTACSATHDAIHALGLEAKPVNTILDYHNNRQYIQALAASVKKHWEQHGQSDCLVMSFHGVPEYTIKKGDPYQTHCENTAQLLAQALRLKPDQWRLVYQSRFGRAKWIEPYCVDVLQALPQEGVKNIDVICPGFACDCLETLEEIEMQNKDIFMQAGGESYRYIPALNDDIDHIAALYDVLVNANTDSHCKRCKLKSC